MASRDHSHLRDALEVAGAVVVLAKVQKANPVEKKRKKKKKKKKTRVDGEDEIVKHRKTKFFF